VARYLVVANRTLGGPALLDLIRELADAGPSAFHVLVPAAPSTHHLTWTDERARSLAHARLIAMLDRLARLGVVATGEIGDAQPLLAMGDVLRSRDFDAIVLATLPAGISRWLHLELPRRAEDVFGLPVLHVVCGVEPSLAR
jgi:hypothetical protein